MQVVLDCPRCLERNVVDVAAAATSLGCRYCDWSREFPPLTGGVPTSCLCCGCHDLWRQKDFPPRLGVLMVGLGIVCSSIAVAYMRPVLALAILMGFALVDMLLFAIMPDRLVCYRCHAHYRGLGKLNQHAVFDLELNERYRQEAARLESTRS